ncbi:hypothetical protein Pstr01_11940 [Pseudomonas straminea]|uniref:Flagellar hook-length control protein FliK n=1 Tax=Pseudomonas straminea TaxID=47882 RepID=A0A1I1TBY2_PSEOC|nr:flagellar hook-length control protein FliK [Pseudomonas straminea]GLX12955.1 hypothetical protein Pstr01_11940 [Pseudomonas straminea]SFD56142.1 flagellar hook-length control protein FliK [Pseudomonas straminea]
MNPVLSGLPSATASTPSDAPLAAAELSSGDAQAMVQPGSASFVIDAEQVLAPSVLDAWPLAEDAMQAPEPEVPASPDAAADPGSEAEQWLASMFGQLEAQLQVREVPRIGDGNAPVPPMVTTPPGAASLRGGVSVEDKGLRQGDVPQPDPQADAQAAFRRAAPVDEISVAALQHKTELAPVEPARAALAPVVVGLGPVPVAAAPVAAATASASPAERTLSLAQVPQAQWGERMIGALRDSVELQFRNGLQQATIRLDPAELGRVEIQLSHEAGRLQVQIQAGQADVVRLLQQTSERLRQDLVGQTFVDVSVQVGGDAQHDRRGRQAPSAWVNESPSKAAQLDEDQGAEARGSRSDVLITV